MFGIKTKKDKRIEHLESLLAMPVAPYQTVVLESRRDAVAYKAQVILEAGLPVEYAKEQIARKIADEMRKHIAFDISDADKFGEVKITGTIYVHPL